MFHLGIARCCMSIRWLVFFAGCVSFSAFGQQITGLKMETIDVTGTPVTVLYVKGYDGIYGVDPFILLDGSERSRSYYTTLLNAYLNQAPLLVHATSCSIYSNNAHWCGGLTGKLITMTITQ